MNDAENKLALQEQKEAAAKAEAERIKKLLAICDIPLSGSLAKGLQNYHGITLMDTLKMMSLMNTKSSADIEKAINQIDAELATRTREDFNPDDPTKPLKRKMTAAEEMMLREDRSRLHIVRTQQHNQKIKEVKLELEATGGPPGKEDKRKKKPGFSPLEIESTSEPQ